MGQRKLVKSTPCSGFNCQVLKPGSPSYHLCDSKVVSYSASLYFSFFIS